MNLINIAYAAGDYTTVGGILTSFTDDILSKVVALIIALGLIAFLWGVLKYVTAGGDEGKASEGRNLMIYGIIALFVMVSVWGLVKILTETFKLDNSAPEIPKLGK